MSQKDDDPFSLPGRHLRLITNDSQRKPEPVPIPRGRVPATPRKPRMPVPSRMKFDVEVPIAHSDDQQSGAAPGVLLFQTPASGCALAERDEPTGVGHGTVHFSQLAEICRRIAEGYYNSPAVLEKVARRIIESGNMGRRARG